MLTIYIFMHCTMCMYLNHKKLKQGIYILMTKQKSFKQKQGPENRKINKQYTH